MIVTAKRRIEQSPLSGDPAVPRGTKGTVDDEDLSADLLVVDFGDPYGHVLCGAEELR